MTKFFCDTSVVYYKLLGPTSNSSLVDAATVGGEVWITNFIRCEFLRGYIGSLIEMHGAIATANDVSEGIAEFKRRFSHNSRKVTNALTWMPDWLVNRQDGSSDPKKTLCRLGVYIRTLVIDLDDIFKNHVSDPLRCEIGVLGFPPEAYRSSQLLDFYEELKAIEKKPACHQCLFKDDTSKRLTANGVDLHSPKQRQKHADVAGYVTQAERLERILTYKRAVPSCKRCLDLGDTIIALSAPSDATLLTSDKSSFPAFGNILGFPVRLIGRDK